MAGLANILRVNGASTGAQIGALASKISSPVNRARTRVSEKLSARNESSQVGGLPEDYIASWSEREIVKSMVEDTTKPAAKAENPHAGTASSKVQIRRLKKSAGTKKTKRPASTIARKPSEASGIVANNDAQKAAQTSTATITDYVPRKDMIVINYDSASKMDPKVSVSQGFVGPDEYSIIRLNGRIVGKVKINKGMTAITEDEIALVAGGV